MTITRAEVEHVARLARLGLDNDEIDRLAAQLSHVLDAMASLNRLDVTAIPPTAQVIPLHTVLRDDVPRPSWPADEILQNAPRVRDRQFGVPTVLED